MIKKDIHAYKKMQNDMHMRKPLSFAFYFISKDTRDLYFVSPLYVVSDKILFHRNYCNIPVQ